MKLKWMCLLFLSLLLSPPLLWGQNHSIKGQIVDAKSNEPLIGVNITVEGTSNGTISDVDGHFTLTATPDAVLKISYIGYREILLKVADLKKDAIISLEEDTKQLEEVVDCLFRFSIRINRTKFSAKIRYESCFTSLIKRHFFNKSIYLFLR